jgi:hypothetical protein
MSSAMTCDTDSRSSRPITAEQMAESAEKRPFDGQWIGVFNGDPRRHRRAGLSGVQTHVVQRVFALPCEVVAAPELACGVELRDLLLRQTRAGRADRREQCQRLLAARPFLEHLRRRLDEVPLDRGARLVNVTGLRQHPMQYVTVSCGRSQFV